MLRRVIRDCRKLYEHSGALMVRRYPTLLHGKVDAFPLLMDDLHRGLLVKVYVTIVRADERWTVPEKKVAAAMIEHLWGEKLQGAELREAATGLFQQADQLSWEALVAPFVRYPPLANSKAQVETLVTRLGNLVAKCDGQAMPEESIALHTLQQSIDMALYPAEGEKSLAELGNIPSPVTAHAGGQQATAQQQQRGVASRASAAVEENGLNPEQRLKRAMAELDSLIGLPSVKDRVRSYANFLKLQQQRRDAGLNTMPISLHMCFVGNPGTGKTTVARIVGQILGAMGTLEKGHVVETDRSGLVAEYAGQTAGKTNKLCDSALGGVLFIDEAYSLVDASGDDAFGREAIQTLLKRMEDDRSSMAVILAGYGNEMEQMIRSNPGLSSRINTTIEFEDYGPADLARIFESMCQQNQYQLPSKSRHRLLLGFDHLYRQRDRHFGNGRLVRNTFEDSVRHLADRLADVTKLTDSLLTTLSDADIHIPGLEKKQLEQLVQKKHRLRLPCDGCERSIVIPPSTLNRKIRCPRCETIQHATWAEVKWT